MALLQLLQYTIVGGVLCLFARPERTLALDLRRLGTAIVNLEKQTAASNSGQRDFYGKRGGFQEG